MRQEIGTPERSPFERLMARVQGLPDRELTREHFAHLVRGFQGQRIYVPKGNERAERLAYARQLLQLGNPRALVVELLRVRFEVSQSTAYQIAGEALASIQPEAAVAAEPKE